MGEVEGTVLLQKRPPARPVAPWLPGCDFTPGLLPSHSRLAAIALLVLDEEESAFWCLVAIVESIMPADYYSKTLTSSQVSRTGRRLGGHAGQCPCVVPTSR